MGNGSTSEGPIGCLYEIGIDVEDLNRSAPFWSAVLGLEVAGKSGKYLSFERQEGGPIVYLQEVPEKKTAKSRMHIDVAVKDVDAALTRIEALGGRKLRAFEKPGTRWIVMVDPDGNEFCILTESGIERLIGSGGGGNEV